MRVDVFGIEFKGPPVMVLRFAPLSFIPEKCGARGGMCLSQRVVKRERFGGGFLCFGKILSRVELASQSQGTICLGKADVSQSVVLIQIDGLLKVSYSLQHLAWYKLEDVDASSLIKLISLWIGGIVLRQLLLLVPGQTDP